MFCPNCGTELEEGALFCGECGTRVEQETQMPQASQIPQTSQQSFRTSVIKTMDKKMLIGLIEIVVLVILVIVFFSLGKKKYSPQAVAERYCRAVVDQNTSAIYDDLYVEDKTFVTKKAFTDKNTAGDESEMDYANKLTQIDAGMTKIKGDVASVEVKIGLGSLNDTQTVVLKKTPKKKFLFFDTWKIVDDDYLNSNYTFAIPEGATATFDGVELSDKYKTGATEAGTVYVLPQVIAGVHDVELNWGDIKGIHMYISSNQDNQVYELEDASLVLGEEQQNDALTAGYEIFQKSLTAQAKKTGFDDIKDCFLKKNQKDAKLYFEENKERFYPDEYNTGIKNVQLSNVKGTVTSFGIQDGKIHVEVSYDYDYDYTYTSLGWFSDETEERQYDGSDSESFTVIYDAGEWKLAGAYVPTI